MAGMSRSCRTCQHLKRPEIDRRLAAGEPSAQVARDYDLNASSLHRHRLNCLKLAARLAEHTAGAQVNVAVQTNVNVDLTQIAERLIKRFDHKPELKARIAQALAGC
jgi:hypothetical protein